MKAQLECLIAQSQILTRTLSNNIDWISEEDYALLSSLYYPLVTNLESLMERQAIDIDYSLDLFTSHPPATTSYEAAAVEERMQERDDVSARKQPPNSDRGEYTEIHICTEESINVLSTLVLNTMPNTQVKLWLEKEVDIFEHVTFVDTKPLLIPFDKTFNLDMINFISRVRTSTRPSEDLTDKQKPLFLNHAHHNIKNGHLAYKNENITFSLKLDFSQTDRLNKSKQTNGTLEVYFDQLYQNTFQNRDRNIAISEDRFVFFIAHQKVCMIDINLLKDHDTKLWGMKLCGNTPSQLMDEKNSVSIYLDHRDHVLYSLDEDGSYAMYKLPDKESKASQKFENLDMLSVRRPLRPCNYGSKFTCITGRYGIVATANFKPSSKMVELYLFLSIKGTFLTKIRYQSDFPIQTMKFMKMKGIKMLLTADYEGNIVPFAVTDDGLIRLSKKNVFRIEEIKIVDRMENQRLYSTKLLDIFLQHSSNSYSDQNIRSNEDLDFGRNYLGRFPEDEFRNRNEEGYFAHGDIFERRFLERLRNEFRPLNAPQHQAKSKPAIA
jgi:hypothetical protein